MRIHNLIYYILKWLIINFCKKNGGTLPLLDNTNTKYTILNLVKLIYLLNYYMKMFNLIKEKL